MIHAKFRRKPWKMLAAALSAAILTAAAWGGAGGMSASAQEAGRNGRGQLNVAYRTQEEISARIKLDGVSADDIPEFVVEPQALPPYSNIGIVSQTTLDSSIKMLNQMRYIAGLQDNVTLNDEYNLKAQAAAMVNALNKSLDHHPVQPAGMDAGIYNLGYEGASSSNLAMGYSSLNSAIVEGWMLDGNESNIDRVGHRRWILNPTMGQTGFGIVSLSTTYTSMYCFDRSNSSAKETQVAWPAQNMPVDYFDATYPWSISMGTTVDKASVLVSLRRVNDNAVWNFSAYGANGYFNVDNGGYGQKGCIIFRPDGITGYQAGDTFEVTITGTGINLSYTVQFFDPSAVVPASPAATVDWTAENARIDMTPDGGAAAILTGGQFEVPAETLNKIAGRNILCAFHIDPNMVFGISGLSMPAQAAAWKADFSYGTDIPAEQLSLLSGMAAATQSFTISGTAFPAPVNLFVNWGPEYAGKLAALYYYDTESGTLAAVQNSVVTESGQAVFTLDQGRQYVAIVVK